MLGLTLNRERRWPRRPSPAVTALTITALLSMAVGLAEIVEFREDLGQKRAYQQREIQEGLSGLIRDLMTVNHLATANDRHHDSEIEEYLAARRDEFSPVRWLGVVGGPDERPRVLLSSPDVRAYNPLRDEAVAGFMGYLDEGVVKAVIPTSHRNVASLALVLGAPNDRNLTLVALIDGDELLDDSLRAQLHANPPLALALSGEPVGHWPRQSAFGQDLMHAPGRFLMVGETEFTVHFASSGAAYALKHVAPLPMTILLAGLAMAFLLRTRPQPPAPAQPVVLSPPPSATNAAAVHRIRLWQLGELAASLSHNLGQPLNVNRLSAEAAQDAIDQGMLDARRLTRTLGTVVDQTMRAQTMLDAVVGSCRRPQTSVAPLNTADVVRQVVAQHEAILRAAGCTLTCAIDPATPPVRGHAHRLAAMLDHLLVNAGEALAAQRLEDVHGDTIHVQCHPKGNTVTISVADNGPGFPPALRNLLMEPLAPPQGIGKGCGLGLAVVLGVAAEMGGQVAIADNEPGTRVIVSLPVAGRSLLVAEDDRAAAAELADALEARGWQVRVAHGGNAALALFDHGGADAVLTDLNMPNGDGWQLIERLRARAPDLPIIVMSTADDHDRRRAVAAGAVLVLRKPVTAREICTELEDLLPIA